MLIKQIQCRCGQLLGERNGNTLIYGAIRLKLKRTHKIECGRCNDYTIFMVERSDKTIDTQRVINENKV